MQHKNSKKLFQSIPSIIVLGGHKLATGYLKKLLQAKQQGFVDYQKLYSIDPDPHSEAANKFSHEVNCLPMSYVDFLSQWMTDPTKNEERESSLLIPDHTAPHVLFQLFVQLIEGDASLKPCRVKLVPFNENLNLPFQKTLDSGVCAISFATWTCPVDCDEPEICPAIKGQRDWDFNERLKKYRQDKSQDPTLSLHFFPCPQLVYGICAIPLRTITSEWSRLRDQIIGGQTTSVIVATHSKCHGIIGKAEVEWRRG